MILKRCSFLRVVKHRPSSKVFYVQKHIFELGKYEILISHDERFKIKKINAVLSLKTLTLLNLENHDYSAYGSHLSRGKVLKRK